MNEAVHEVDIDAPVAVVWSVLTDVSRMPELSPSTEAVHAPDRLRAVGDEFQQVVRLAGRRFRSRWTVTSFAEARELAVAGRIMPGTRYEMVEQLEPVGRDRTRLRLTMRWRLPLGPVGRLAGRLGAERRALAEAQAVVAGVKRLAEDAAVTT